MAQGAATMSNARLLMEIQEAAIACIKRKETSTPKLEAVVVQTRGALGMLRRMPSSPIAGIDGSWHPTTPPLHLTSCRWHAETDSTSGNPIPTTIASDIKFNTQPPQASGQSTDASQPGQTPATIEPVSETPESNRSSYALSVLNAVAETVPEVTNHAFEFPSELLLSREEMTLHAYDARRKDQYSCSTKRATWPTRSQSTEGLNDLKTLFEQRVRQGRERSRRRKSFSLGVSQHENSDHSDFMDTNEAEGQAAAIARFRCQRQGSFTPFSFSSVALGNCQEWWPDSVVHLLTNGQRIEARLKTFKHFTALMKLVEEGGQSGLSPPRHNRLKLSCGAFSIPRPGKPNGGEDAYFHNADEEDFSFAGVADGVGEWGEYDCCPRQFAQELMNGSRGQAKLLPYYTDVDKLAAPAGAAHEKASQRALHVLKAGFTRALASEDCFGSSTSIVAGLDAKGENLGVANLGDSSCIVLRRSPHLFRHMTIAKRTKEQQHFFNCPYQLSKVPEKKDIPTLERRGLVALTKVISNMKHGAMTDSPEMASLHDLKVREGDLVILGSDGLFDNLFDSEIIYLASLVLSPYESKLFFRGQSFSAPCSPADSDNGSPPPPELSSARRMTEAWVSGNYPHPLAVEPPVATLAYGIATPAAMVARGLAEAAFYRSLDPRARTPFAKAAKGAGCQVTSTGGKMDDITVVACWVTADSSSPHSPPDPE